MNYQQAYTTRNTGLGKLIVNRIRSGQSATGSIGSSISDKMLSYGVGLKEAFDPLNVAKRLTFGSNLAPALLGRMTGRSTEDIRYFSREKRKSPSLRTDNDYANYMAQPMANSESMTKLLNFMKKVQDYKEVQLKTAQSFHEEEMLENFHRHKEVVEVFLEAINKHRSGQKEVSTKSKEKKKKLLDIPIGKIILGAGAIASIALPTIASAKVGEPQRQPEPVEPPEPPGPLDTATKVPSLPSVPPGTVDTMTGIRTRESRGDYGAAFGMIRGNKKGKESLQLPEEFNPQKKRLDQMTLGEVRAYQNYRLSKDKASAVGAYQFTKTTLFGDSKTVGLVQKLGMDDNTTFNKDTQDKLAERLRQDNRAILERAGVPITPGTEYAAWYVGPGGTVRVHNAVKSGNGNQPVANIINPQNPQKIIENNPELGTKTANELFPVLQARVEESLPKFSGEVVASRSVENVDMKKQMKRQVASSGVIVSNNNNVYQQNNVTVTQPEPYAHPMD